MEVKIVQLDPEYKALMGKALTRFKEIYSVKFDAKTVEGQPIIAPDTQEIALCFRSSIKEVVLKWKMVHEASQKKPEAQQQESV
jgi:hypothetical protein